MRFHCWFYFCCICSALTVAGCATWSERPSEPSSLPSLKAPPNSVGLEVAFVETTQLSEDLDEKLWSAIDEQHLSSDFRRRLETNGFRCGLVGSQIPSTLRRLIENPSSPVEFYREETIGHGDGATKLKHIQGRIGRKRHLIASSIHEQITVLLNENGLVQGETFGQAQCIFSLKTHPQGDGRVLMELTPEIHHGETRPHYVGRDGSLQIEAGRDKKTYDRLRMKVLLAPGQTLLLASTPQPKGLGRQFFRETSDGSPKKKLLLIRLSHTQLDDLFSPEQKLSPIVTPDEE